MYNYRTVRTTLLIEFSWSNYYNFINDFTINVNITEPELLLFCKNNFINFQSLTNKILI